MPISMFIWVVNATLFIQQTCFIRQWWHSVEDFKTRVLLDRFSLEQFIPCSFWWYIRFGCLIWCNTQQAYLLLDIVTYFLFPYRVVFQILNTSKGYITVELYKDGSPEVVDRFLDLWWVYNKVYTLILYMHMCTFVLIENHPIWIFERIKLKLVGMELIA